MADHFIGINRGKDTFTPVNFVRGTSTGATDIELRYGDALNLTRKDIVLALHGIIRLLEKPGSAPDGQNFPVL